MEMGAAEELTESEGASLLAACWRALGFGAKRPRIKTIVGQVAQAECTLCKGDVCSVETLEISLSQGHLPPASADGKLVGALLGQPLSLALIALHFVFAIFSISRLPPMIAGLFAPVGGPMNALLLMLAIHAAEGLFAVYVCVTGLKIPLAGAVGWAFAVALTGFASLRWLLKLQKTSSIRKHT